MATSGIRCDTETAIFNDLKQALYDGIDFYRPDSGAFLTRGI